MSEETLDNTGTETAKYSKSSSGFFNLRNTFKDVEEAILKKGMKGQKTKEEAEFMNNFGTDTQSLISGGRLESQHIFKDVLKRLNEKEVLNNPRVVNRRTMTIFLLRNIDLFVEGILSGVLTNSPRYQNPHFLLPMSVVNNHIGNIDDATRAASMIALSKILVPRLIAELSRLAYDIDASEQKVTIDDFISQSASHAEWSIGMGKSSATMKKKERDAIRDLTRSFRTPITPLFKDKDGVRLDGELPTIIFPKLRKQYFHYTSMLERNYEVKPDYDFVKLQLKSFKNSNASTAATINEANDILKELDRFEELFEGMDAVELFNAQTSELISEQAGTDTGSTPAKKKKEFGEQHDLFQAYFKVLSDLTSFYWEHIAGSMWFKAISLKWKKVVSKIETNYVIDAITAATAETSAHSRQTFAPVDFFFSVEHEVRKFGTILNKAFIEEVQNANPSRTDLMDAFKVYSQPMEKVMLCDGELQASGTHEDLTENKVISFTTSRPFAEHTDYKEVLCKGNLGLVFKANNTITPLVTGEISASKIIEAISTIGENKDRDQTTLSIDLTLENVMAMGFPVYNGNLDYPVPYSILDANHFGKTAMYQVERISESRSHVRSVTDLNGLRVTNYLSTEVSWFDELYTIRTANNEVGQLIADYMLAPVYAGVEFLKPKIVNSFSTKVKIKDLSRTAMAARLDSKVVEFFVPMSIIQTVQRWDRTQKILGDINLNQIKFEKRYITARVNSTIDAYVADQMLWIKESSSLKQLDKAIQLFSGDEIAPTTSTLAAYDLVVRTVAKVSMPWVRLIIMAKLLDKINDHRARISADGSSQNNDGEGRSTLIN